MPCPEIFNTMLKLKNTSNGMPSGQSPISHRVRLPKLDVLTIDDDILNWITLWEQFTVALHDHSHLSKAEKLAYLRHSLKEGAAK